MRGLNRGPLRSAEVQQSVPYEDVYKDEDGMRALIDEMNANENATSNAKVRDVNDLDDIHVVNGLETNDDFLNVDNLNGEHVQSVPARNENLYVSAASAPIMQNANERERVTVTRAVVHAAPQQTGAPVSRVVSPFSPEPAVSCAEDTPATMSAVTNYTTTTTTPMPFATRSRDDFLRMSNTAYTRLIICDRNAAQAAYVTWHGQQEQILGTTEAPHVSLPPSYSMPAAIHVSSQRAYQHPIEASTPLQAPPRRHEDEQLNSTSDGDPFFTPTQGKSRFEPYPATNRKRKPVTTVRAAVNGLDRLREYNVAPRTVKKPRVVSNVRLQLTERAAYAPVDPFAAPLDPYARPREAYVEPPRVAQAKQSTSFVPQAAPVPIAAPRTKRTRGSGPNTPLQRQMCDASTQTDSSEACIVTSIGLQQAESLPDHAPPESRSQKDASRTRTNGVKR